MSYEEYPWDDTPSTYQEYRALKNMPLRTDWNTRPAFRDCPQCIVCGYKWYPQNFRYRVKQPNGQDGPLMDHNTCWNCHMWATETDQMLRAAASLDGAQPHKPASLKKFGGFNGHS